MTLSRIFGRIASRPARRPSPRRKLRVERLEGRELQSGVVGAPVADAIQGNHIGTSAAMIQGAHIGTNAMIQGNHIW